MLQIVKGFRQSAEEKRANVEPGLFIGAWREGECGGESALKQH